MLNAGIDLTFPPGYAYLAECVRRAKLDTAHVEMILTRGVCSTFSRELRDAVNTFIAFADPARVRDERRTDAA